MKKRLLTLCALGLMATTGSAREQNGAASSPTETVEDVENVVEKAGA